MNAELAALIGAFIAAGLFAGFIGGLFGVGGGIVIVPTLYHLMGVLDVDDSVRMHVAIGTSLSTIIATSLRSLETHRRAGAVDMHVLRAWSPWVALGAALGAAAAGVADTDALLIIFGAGLFLVSLNMGFGAESWRLARDLPRGAGRAGLGGGIGFLSAMMGVGGGSFGVTAMTLCGRPIHQAVATASGFGIAIALPATFGYVLTGWNADALPWGSLGYVNAPGFALLALLTSLTAPIGARAAHRMDRALLRRAFAVFLALTSLNLLREGVF